MKIRYGIIIIFTIFVITCSPALAMSKADILASYKDYGPDELWALGPPIPRGPSDYSDDNFPCADPYWFNPLTPGLPWKNDVGPEADGPISPVDTAGWTKWTFPDFIMEKPRSRIHYPIIFMDPTAISG
jgi:hypothetical protein